jgi:hypothetical protein
MKFPQAVTQEVKRTEILKPQFHNEKVVEQVEHYWCNAAGQSISEIGSGETLYLKASFKTNHRPRNLILGVPVWTEEGGYVTGFSTEIQEEPMNITPEQRITFLLKIPNVSFNPGAYLSNFVITDGPEFLYRGSNAALTVLSVGDRFWGVVTLPHSWQISTETAELS